MTTEACSYLTSLVLVCVLWLPWKLNGAICAMWNTYTPIIVPWCKLKCIHRLTHWVTCRCWHVYGSSRIYSSDINLTKPQHDSYPDHRPHEIYDVSHVLFVRCHFYFWFTSIAVVSMTLFLINDSEIHSWRNSEWCQLLQRIVDNLFRDVYCNISFMQYSLVFFFCVVIHEDILHCLLHQCELWLTTWHELSELNRMLHTGCKSSEFCDMFGVII